MFKQRKNRTFNYKPRFSKENQEAEVNVENPNEFVSKWRRTNGQGSKKIKGLFSMRFLILALVLLLICMYLLEHKYM